VPEPFLLVGLIAATRRILVVTAEFAELAEGVGVVFQHAMLELGLLTIFVVGPCPPLEAVNSDRGRSGLNGGKQRGRQTLGRPRQTGVSATWCRGADPTDVGRWGVDPAWRVGSIGRAVPDAAQPP
jgi:hypothetical protein